MTITHNEYDRGSRPVISVYNLRKRFDLEKGSFAPLGRHVHAVNGVSFSIDRNEAYGLVGETGCGMTAAARLLVRMYEADEGEILFRGYDKVIQDYVQDVRQLKGKDFRCYRERVKYVFRNPARSLDPRMTIFQALTSAFRWSTDRFQKRDQASLREEAASILEEVGLSDADLERHPEEFSNGQRQMISIARGLMMKPDLLICDEVVSALDVSMQVQILNLLLDLRERRKSSGEEISFLFVAGDLKTAMYFCDRIGVMYQGEIVEEAPVTALWKSRLHPYTELFFSLTQNAGPESLHITSGCAFAPRCPHAEDACFREKPPLAEADDDHFVRCWR